MEKTFLLIANILSLIGNVLATTSAILKSKKTMLVFQSSNHVLEIIAQLLTQAYSGMVQEVISLVRNVIFLFVKTAKKLPKLIISVLCLVAGVVSGVLFNIFLSGNVLYGYLPVAGAAVYAIFVILAFLLEIGERKAELLMKTGLLFNVTCWGIYGFFIKLYPVLIFNGVSIVLLIISLVRIFISTKKARAAATQIKEEPAKDSLNDTPEDTEEAANDLTKKTETEASEKESDEAAE